MAFNYVRRPRPFITHQDINDPSEQQRYWSCNGCIHNRVNLWKMDKETPRFICKILDVDNKAIAVENEGIANPMLRKPLRRCIHHPEIPAEEPI